MTRYRLNLEYDGRPFVGWQRQENGPSVQGALEEAVRNFCGETVNAVAAGRTDAGVHALCMCAHMDIAKAPPADVVRDALNYHLSPAPVAVLDARIAPPDFHARFSATARHYRYRILNRRAPSALDTGRVWRIPRTLDAEAMDAGAKHLLGRHDFTTFRAAQCQADTPVKTLTSLECRRAGEEIVVTASAPSFLHRQIRSFVGSLVEVGAAKWAPEDVARALKSADRRACGPVAPPQGLYFVRAEYADTAD